MVVLVMSAVLAGGGPANAATYHGGLNAGTIRLKTLSNRTVDFKVKLRVGCSTGGRVLVTAGPDPARRPRLRADGSFGYRERGNGRSSSGARYSYSFRVAGHISSGRANGIVRTRQHYGNGVSCGASGRWTATRA
jgi:hypothetical protein